MDNVACKKGLSFIAARDHVLQEHGKDCWAAVLSSLPREDVDTLGSVLGVGWYGLDLYARLMRAVGRTLGRGDLGAVRPVVRFEAERDVPTIHRMLLRMVKPAYVFEKMAELWPRYHTTGSLAVVRRDARTLEATISDWAADELLCLGVQVYCERVLELVGARDPRVVQTSCRALGAPGCQFHATYG
jgi:hypothetical protein